MAIIDMSSGTYRSIYGGAYENTQNELEEVMELKEARKCAENIRLHKAALISGATNYPLTSRDEACLALDNRIIELEGQRDELLKNLIEDFKLLFYIWDNNELSPRQDAAVEGAINKTQGLIEKVTGKPWGEINQPVVDGSKEE